MHIIRDNRELFERYILGVINKTRHAQSRGSHIRILKYPVTKLCPFWPVRLIIGKIGITRFTRYPKSRALHQNGGGDRCRKVQFAEIEKISDLDLDLGSVQGHINMCNTYRTASMPDHVTVASSSKEIWPFEIRVILAFHEL